ncbi:MAG: GNAT family N-acetyltransferase [Steroidobacteraceae bacterium]
MIEARELSSIDAVPAAQWNALTGTDCPFLRHEFLAALEHNGCVGAGTGWTPAHLALFDGHRLIAAAPVYRKTHSWGEFVFDFSWAQAYDRNGMSYYPKLLCAVPFSPVNSARLLLDPAMPQAALLDAVIETLEARCAAQGLSSAHALFIGDAERAAFAGQDWLLRSDVQFHWHNAGYGDFEAYLGTFRSEKRKQIRRERRRCEEAGVQFLTVHGTEITPAQLQFAYAAHARTFHLHGHEPYLNLACFTEIARTLGDALMVKLALQGGQPVAAAVFMKSDDVLYGRYWGATGDFHSLHFEACYHQGIDYCIEHGLSRFEPGTQGEHKVVRGFVPSQTWSAHYIADGRFRHAIADFLVREQSAVEAYAGEIAAHSPFRRE